MRLVEDDDPQRERTADAGQDGDDQEMDTRPSTEQVNDEEEAETEEALDMVDDGEAGSEEMDETSDVEDLGDVSCESDPEAFEGQAFFQVCDDDMVDDDMSHDN